MDAESPIYEFGDFRLDVGEKQLRRLDGEVLTIPPKAFELLVYLVQNPRHLLEKNELMDKVWSDSFVEEGNLKIHVHTLRKALNEDGAEYIETVPRRGYRFNADVRDAGSGDLIVEKITQSRLVIQESESSDLPLALTGRRGRSFASYGLAAAVIVGLLSFVYFGFLRPRAAASSIDAGKGITAIAVLPFKNLTEDKADQFLGVGMADALNMRLSVMRQLVVRPTSAVLRYGGTPEQAGDTLHVDNLLEGTIQRAGDRLRISVQLVQVRDQKILWAKNFDETGADLLKVQDTIASGVANSLFSDISPSDHSLLARRETNDEVAYESYLKGRFFWNKRTVDDLKRSVELFEQATQRDPSFALAFVGAADGYQLLGEYGGLNAAEATDKARAAVHQALALNDALAEAHTTNAYMLAFVDWNWAEAEKEFKRAIELNPNYSTARQWYGEYLTTFARYDEAMTETRRAELLDPTSPIIQTDIAGILYLSREYDQALEQTKKIIELDPKFAYAYAYQWIGYEQSGRIDQAFESLITLDSIYFPPEMISVERDVYAAGGWKGFWQWRYDRRDKPPFDKLVSNYTNAIAAHRVGLTGQTFEYLDRSRAAKERWFVDMNVDPQWDTIRNDPRFTELVRKAGL